MTLDALIMLTGAFVATLPFLGFPNSWDAALFLAAGIMVIALGIVVRRRDTAAQAPLVKRDADFVQHSQSPTALHGQS